MTWLVGAALLIGSVAVFDVAARDALAVIDEGPPLASLPFLVRSACLAAGAVALVVGVDRLSGRWALPQDRTRGPIGLVTRPAPLGVPVVAAAGATVVLALMLWWPMAFTRFALEDGPAEDVTAVLLLASAVVLVARAVGLARRAARRAAVVLAALAVGYLVLGMEEISWGQRLLGFSTPAAFADNMQGEANLHNFATNIIEVLFYAGTTAVFVLVPLLQHATRVLDRWPRIAALTPSFTLLLAFAPAAALTYDMWNISPVQFSFWGTIATLAYLSAPASKLLTGQARVLAATMLVLCLATQVAVLLLGGRTGRLWDATEYRELFTVAAMAWYALSLYAAPHPHDTPRPPPPSSTGVAEGAAVAVGGSPTQA